jgi:hypothetical protein
MMKKSLVSTTFKFEDLQADQTLRVTEQGMGHTHLCVLQAVANN